MRRDVLLDVGFDDEFAAWEDELGIRLERVPARRLRP
jgi:hypothetical protein